MPSGPRPPIPPTYARVAISGTTQTKPFTWVFYLSLTGSSITTTDLNTLAGDLLTAWNGNIAGQVTTDTVVTSCVVVYVPSVGNELVGSATASYSGSHASATVADASACFVVNWHINAYYRGGHPRTYHPGVAAADVSNGSTIASSRLTTLVTAFTNYLSAVNALTTTNITAVVMGCMSFQTGNNWRTTPLFRPFKSVTARSFIGSQRRRITA